MTAYKPKEKLVLVDACMVCPPLYSSPRWWDQRLYSLAAVNSCLAGALLTLAQCLTYHLSQHAMVANVFMLL